MRWSQVEGHWSLVKGHAKLRWSALTEGDLANLAGTKDALIGKLEERYGFPAGEAEKQVDDWVSQLPPQSQRFST